MYEGQLKRTKDEELEHWFNMLKMGGIKLAILAVIRMSDANPEEVRIRLGSRTGEILSVDESKILKSLESLERKGFVTSYQRSDDRPSTYYRITPEGKSFLFSMLKQWNRYIDAMNNLWGCYYGT